MLVSSVDFCNLSWSFEAWKLDWQDSRISRGNGKWICGKIPAGNGLREIAGKMRKIWPNFWLKLIQNWLKIESFEIQFCVIVKTTNIFMVQAFWTLFHYFPKIFNSLPSTFWPKISYVYIRILSRISRGIPRDPAGNGSFFPHSCGKSKPREFSHSSENWKI